MAQLARFTTDGVAARERLSRWDAALWGLVAPLRTTADATFEGDANYGSIGPINVLLIDASAHCLRHDESAAKRMHGGLVQLIVQRRGVSSVTQSGRELQLQPGCWTICDTDRPFAVTSPERGEQLIMLMPRERLGLGRCLPAHAARVFGDTGGTARLLPCYLAGLMDEIGGVDDSNRSELADMAAQLVRLSLFEARHATPPVSMRETLRLRVKDYVRRNLRDPALSIDGVATAFGCTKRHLHKVFSGGEATLNQFIWQQRLECCREALTSPRLARHSITEIAFMWGFNNSAHFSKAFKERFGVPPGHFRERAAEPRRLPACSAVGRVGREMIAAL